MLIQVPFFVIVLPTVQGIFIFLISSITEFCWTRHSQSPL